MEQKTETFEIEKFLDREIPFAILENGEYIKKNSLYVSLEKKLGEKGAKAISCGKTCVLDGNVYYGSMIGSGGTALVIANHMPLYEYIADALCNISRISVHIKTLINSMEHASMLIRKSESLKKDPKTALALKELETGILEIFSEISTLEEFADMRDTADSLVPLDLLETARICADNLKDALKDKGKDIKINVSGAKHILAEIRLESIRKICAEAVREALVNNTHTESISFNVGEKKGKAVFSLEIVSDKNRPSEFEEFLPTSLLTPAAEELLLFLLDEMCSLYGAEKIYIRNPERTYIEFDFKQFDKRYLPDDYEQIYSRAVWRRFPEKYSPENSELASVYRKDYFEKNIKNINKT